MPSLWRFRLFTPLPDGASLVPVAAPKLADSAPVGETKLVIETKDEPDLRQPEVVPIPAAAASLGALEVDKPPVPIEGPDGALDAFYAKLLAAEKEGAEARSRA